MKEKTEAANKVQDLKNKINQLQNEIKGNDQLYQEQKDKIAALERDYLDKLRLAREEEWEKLAVVESEKAELQAQLSNIKHRSAEKDNRNESTQKEFFVELDRIKKESQELRQQIDNLQTENKSLVSDKEHQTMAIDQVRTKAEEAAVQVLEKSNIIDSLQRKFNSLK